MMETKKGFVAGAFYKEGLGDIDLVWGNKDYGLEHILKRREKQALNNGINEAEAKEYALNIAKTIPEVINKGVKVERNGRVAIEYENIRVGLKDNWKGEKLPNHWVITGYEKRLENSESLYTSPLITKGETLPLNSNEPNPTTKKLNIRNKMNYPNLPNSALEITEQPQVKEITNELLKQLQNALHSNALFTDQVELSLKGIVRILEVLLSLDFFKNANEIDSSLRNSIEWLSNAGESLKLKMKEYEGFFSEFNTSMRENEQEVTNTLNANAENIKSEIKKLEKQLIETTTKLLTSYQIFLNNAKESANNEINTNQTQAITNINEAKNNANNEITANQTQALNNINEAKVSATNQINTNKQEVLNNITQQKQQAYSEITEAKNTIIIKTLIFFEIE